ncbi:hypothetical protein ACFLQ0_03415 [Nitrospinota bacterium]
MAAERDEEISRTWMMGPGAAFAIIGAAILLAAIFILPDRVDTGVHDHPVGQTEKRAR